MCTSASFEKNMTTTPSFIARLQALAGPDVAAAITAEYGGTTVYVRPPVKVHRIPPAFRISGTFRDDEVTLRDSVAAVGAAAIAMSLSASDLVVEVDTRGLGHAVLDRLRDALPSAGIQVISMQRGTA